MPRGQIYIGICELMLHLESKKERAYLSSLLLDSQSLLHCLAKHRKERTMINQARKHVWEKTIKIGTLS